MKSLLFLLCAIVVAGNSNLLAQSEIDFPNIDAERSAWFINRTGDCCFCSVSMCGLHQNIPAATYALYTTDEYGKAWRGGCYPSRMESFADARGIPIYNVTGNATYEWMKWAGRTGRMCAIGCFSAHFQTLLWWNPDPADPKPWKIKNNWGVEGKYNVRNWYALSDAEFRRQHEASGKWVVILKGPPPPLKPQYVAWWR